ncbi:MAG: T9SS type A sorting domain-containing protein [Saprospiraceae bacterium]|nr:T9SS type A sorting domain-containing protein [Saprospiraceae bacterium]
MIFGLYLVFLTSVFGQNSYNIAIDSVKVLKPQGSIKCAQIHDLVIYWKVTSSNSSANYPTCQTSALFVVSPSGAVFPNLTGGYSNRLEWILFEESYYGVQNASIPLGNYRDTLKIMSPMAVGNAFSVSAQVDPSSGAKSPDCNAGTITNSITGIDDVKTSLDTVKSCSALPILLKNLNAAKLGVDTEISWESIVENNFSHYSVEHSIDAVNFIKIASKSGNGNKSRYTYIHSSPTTGLNYYRLKMIDLDGTFVYSDVKAVNFSTERNSLLNVYPNPFSQVFTIENLQAPSDISVFDMTGKLMRQMSVTDSHVLMDLAQQPSGIYSVIIKDKIDTKVFRVIKS